MNAQIINEYLHKVADLAMTYRAVKVVQCPRCNRYNTVAVRATTCKCEFDGNLFEVKCGN